MIASQESYKIVEQNGITIEKGSLGKNILIDWNPYHLLPGERFVIGEVTYEITQNYTLYKGLPSVDAKLP
ncbi:MAG: hypothetical protein WBF77_00895 [Sulfurimonadaceae bacterium]